MKPEIACGGELKGGEVILGGRQSESTMLGSLRKLVMLDKCSECTVRSREIYPDGNCSAAA